MAEGPDTGSQGRFDFTTDVLVIGSGAAGAAAAITAHAGGLHTLILEKNRLLGGTTALSGGGIWAPGNRFMRASGIPDSIDAAQQYMSRVVGHIGPATSAVRQRAFLQNINPALDFLEQQGVRFRPISHYADYYPELPGASTAGRGVEPALFDLKKLGDWLELLPPRFFPRTWPLSNAQAANLYLARRTVRGFCTLAHILSRYLLGRARGQALTGLGAALAGQLLYVIKSRGIALWTETCARKLIMDGERVVGMIVSRGGQDLRIRARRAVLLGGGGFARNLEMRSRYRPQITHEWSSANVLDTGDMIALGTEIGADLAAMDEAWWVPTTLLPDGRTFFLVSERSKPGTIIVDQSGSRYLNESKSYEDVVRDMFARHATTPAIPSWMIFDSAYRNKYPFGFMLPGRTPQSLIDAGYFRRAASLQKLAELCGIDAAALSATVSRFNSMAGRGVDEDFHRGENAYDRHYGDPRIRPNPNLAAIEQPPFYAVALYPGDLGTKGGLVTDEYGRVLRASGAVIQGLYASGNATASVMGRTYPGGGATLGPAITFSFIAMRHVLGQRSTPTT